jgi:exonuclease SbcC
LRSVLLSQGEFTRFLKADPKERSLLLENMTDTAIFSKISLFVFEQSKTHQQALSMLDGQLENVNLLTDNEMQALQIEKTTLENDIKAAVAAEAEARGHLQWFKDIKMLQQQLTDVRIQLEAFNKEKTEALPSLTALQKHLQAEPIYFHWERIEAAKEQLIETAKKITLIKTKHDSLVEAIYTAKSKESNAYSKYTEAVELQKNQAPILDIVQQLDATITKLHEEIIVQNNLLINHSNDWEKSKLATEKVKTALFAKEQAARQRSLDGNRMA